MHFDERAVGEYRIYAGAMEVKGGGYVAAVVVRRQRGMTAGPEVFRDECMSGGHRWAQPDEALKFAFNKAEQFLQQQRMPVC